MVFKLSHFLIFFNWPLRWFHHHHIFPLRIPRREFFGDVGDGATKEGLVDLGELLGHHDLGVGF